MGKGYKGRNPRGVKPKDPLAGSDEEEEKKFVPVQRGLGNQASTVGMMPPSDSEEEEEEEVEAGAEKAGAEKATSSAAEPAEKKPAAKPQKKAASSSEDESSDDSGDDVPEYFKTTKKKEPVKAAPDPEQVRKDLERLEMIRKKREEDRLKRIAAEGWDRFAPVTESNHPPAHKE